MIRFLEGDDLIIPDESQLPFKLLRNLGHGHSGNVEEVENVLTGAVFARKTIKIRGQRAKIATENIFKNEVKIIRGLSKHHHIIRVFATYMAKREVGIILEPVADEGDLSHFLELIEDIRLSDASDTIAAAPGSARSSIWLLSRWFGLHAQAKSKTQRHQAAKYPSTPGFGHIYRLWVFLRLVSSQLQHYRRPA
jgi:hypothetical protein